MDDYVVHDDAVVHAYQLIDDRHVVLGTDWEESHPTLGQQEEFIARNSWDAFARWHLALDPSVPPETIGHYQFAYGDGVRVHRSALVSCVTRARRRGDRKLEQAAEELLRRIDAKAGIADVDGADV